MKALPSQPVSIRLNTEEKAIYMEHGGAKLFKKWLRELEKKSKKLGKVPREKACIPE
jgi:hypothetical protein